MTQEELPPDVDTTPTPEEMPQATDDHAVPGPLAQPREPLDGDE